MPLSPLLVGRVAATRLVDVDRVADADRGLEVPRHAEERDRRALLEPEARLEAGGDREHAGPVEDPPAELRRLGELLVGVERVEVAGQAGEQRRRRPR